MAWPDGLAKPNDPGEVSAPRLAVDRPCRPGGQLRDLRNTTTNAAINRTITIASATMPPVPNASISTSSLGSLVNRYLFTCPIQEHGPLSFTPGADRYVSAIRARSGTYGSAGCCPGPRPPRTSPEGC